MVTTGMETIGAFAMGIAVFVAVQWFVYTVADIVRRHDHD